MDATPAPEHDDLALLLASDDPDLPSDRHVLLKERLLSNLVEQEHHARSRRRLAVRVAAPIALTAAVAVAAAVVLNPSPTTSGHATTSATRSAVPRVSSLPEHISTVAYTLDLQRGDIVKITIRNFGDRKPDAAALQQDLARMGLTAEVSERIPDCFPQIYNLAERDANGDYVATVHRELIGKYPEIIVFEANASDTSDAATLTVSVGTKPGAEPTCAPLPENTG
jgi:hypothetical protein